MLKKLLLLVLIRLCLITLLIYVMIELINLMKNEFDKQAVFLFIFPHLI